MRNVVIGAVVVLILAVAGGVIYYTQLGGRDQAALAAVQRFFADEGVDYETLVLDGGVIVGENLRWTDGATTVTAARLELEGLDAVAAAGAAVSSGSRPRLLERGRLETIAINPAGAAAPIRIESFTVEDFAARRLLAFFQEAQAPDADGLATLNGFFNDVLSLGDMRMENLSFDPSAAAGAPQPAVSLASLQVSDAVDGAVGTFAFNGMAVDAGGARLAALETFEILDLDLSALFATAAARREADAAVFAHETADPEALSAMIDAYADAFAQASLDRAAIVGLAVDGRPMGQDLSFEIGEYSINGLNGEALDLFLMSGLRYAGTAPNTGPIEASVGRVSLEDFNLAPARDVLKQINLAAEDPRNRLPDPEAFERASVAMQLGSKSRIEDIEVNAFGGAFTFTTPRPATVTGAVEAFEADGAYALGAGPLAAMPIPPSYAAVLAGANIERVDAVTDYTLNVDLETRDLDVETISLALNDLLTISLEGAFGDYGRVETFSTDSDNPAAGFGPYQELYGDMTVKDATLTIAENGFLDLAMAFASTQTGEAPDQYRARLAALAQGFLPGALAAPVVTFLDEGGSLTLRAAPPQPLRFIEFAPVLSDPAALGVSLAHTPREE